MLQMHESRAAKRTKHLHCVTFCRRVLWNGHVCEGLICVRVSRLDILYSYQNKKVSRVSVSTALATVEGEGCKLRSCPACCACPAASSASAAASSMSPDRSETSACSEGTSNADGRAKCPAPAVPEAPLAYMKRLSEACRMARGFTSSSRTAGEAASSARAWWPPLQQARRHGRPGNEGRLSGLGCAPGRP